MMYFVAYLKQNLMLLYSFFNLGDSIEKLNYVEYLGFNIILN